MDTEIVKLSADIEDEVLLRAAGLIKDGRLVVFPTETVYGLGADATNAEAAKKIYEAKGRPSDNPLIIHISDPTEAEKYAYTCDVYYRLAAEFMPGPLTVIMKAKETVPLATRGGLPTVAVRCPENRIANKLLSFAGVPIAAPSANLSGSPSPTSASHVIEDMRGRVDMIIDGGECEFGLESTIVKIEDDGSLVLLRPGRITVDDLTSLGFVIRVADAVTDELRPGETALSPGMKYRHYAPSSPVVLLEGEIKKIVSYIRAECPESPALIWFDEDAERIKNELPEVVFYNFGKSSDVLYQAHSLFSLLRMADKGEHSVIYAPLPTKKGIGLALYNRLIRASAHKIIKL